MRAGACLPQRSVHDLPHRTRSGRHEPAEAAAEAAEEAAEEAAAEEAEAEEAEEEEAEEEEEVVGLQWGR